MRYLLLTFCLLTGCFNYSSSKENPDLTNDLSKYKAVFTSAPQHVPTAKTPDAPLAGNGDIGITMGGDAGNLCFHIGKNDFWRAYPVYPGGGIASPGGMNIRIDALDGAAYYAEQYPDKAEITGRFTKNNLEVNLRAWVAATRNLVVIELTSNQECEAKIELWSTQGNSSVNDTGRKENISWVSRSFENTPLLEWSSHIAMALQTPDDSVIHLKPDENQFIAIAIYTNHDRQDWKEAAIVEAKNSRNNIEVIRSEHRQWWNAFWTQSRISIDDDFLEKYYYSSLYLLASSTRKDKFAPGIWGSYITQDYAAWGGDYHLNYNYQAPYWALFSSNHIELTDNFDQPVLDYMEKGKEHAGSLLNCRGIYYPVGLGPKGLCTTRWPLTPEEMFERYASLENTLDDGYKFLGQKINAVFSVGNMMMRFYSTYDLTYARKVYPYILECTKFWEDYLSFENGRYVIRMDHFNEVMPNKRNNGIWRDKLGDFNSTLSLGLVRMLFKGAIDISTELGKENESREKWLHILEHLSEYPLGKTEDGRVSLKNMEKGPGNSEPMAVGLNRVSIHGLILPAGVCGPLTDPVFNEILRNDVAHWIDRKTETGGWGNTMGNGIETCFPGAVRVGYDPDIILEELKERIKTKSHPNYYIIQEGGGIETLAAVPLTINEMLMQSYEGVVRIFPNWNRSKNASFINLRAYGAFLVSSRLYDGNIESVKLRSEKGRTCKIENPWKGNSVQLWRNSEKAEQLSGDFFEFETTPNETIELKINTL